MKKSQSFHIITKGSLTQKGDFIGSDIYNNSIFISSKTKLLNNVTEISEDSPLFCLAKVEEVFNKKVNGIKLHFLKCYYAEFDLINMVSSFTEDFIVELENSEKHIDNFMFIKLIIDEYNFYKEKKQFLTTNNFGFNRNTGEDNYNLPYLFLSKECFELKNKLDKYINFYGYDSKIINKDGDYLDEFEINNLIFNIQNKNNYSFSIGLRPFYKSLRFINNNIEKTSTEPFKLIVTKNVLKDFNPNAGNYFEQFYKLNDINSQINDEELSYILETQLEFDERIKSNFDEMFVYVIRPIIDELDYGRNKISTEKLHQNLIDIIEDLEKKNIFNVIVIPPDFIYYQILQEIDYHLNPPIDDDYNTYDGWAELGGQEMNRMDEETDGFWRY